MPDGTGNKLCPSCFIEIEKTGGCNHMRCRQCQNNFCWQCGSFDRTMSYHKVGVPCIAKKWWTGEMKLQDDPTLVCVPEIVSQEMGAHATLTRMQNLHHAAARSHCLDTSSLGYARHLSVGAIMQQERNVLEAHILAMNTRLRLHLEQAKTSGSIDRNVVQALAAL